MISVILYGRNDSHGYNLHKRAAISFNCIAEMLSDPDDEIIFVDYNTPNDLPTFVEAIYDTLTAAARKRLRVLRVRPQLHARMVERTHLSALEPHSRNIAIRRSNPRNRWILSTNTDMIFLPRSGSGSLAGAVRDLPDGQYIVPRYELPEPLWESFPRSDPEAVMRACEELGPKLHLHEIAIRFPYMRFDSPGDFQLAPRQAFFDIHGFDERMIHGWHADSNMCKRLYLFCGERTESLAHRIKAYHCDHTRVATLAHRLDIKLENNLQEFVYGVTDPVAHHQAEKWGVPNEPIEELDFANDPAPRFACALERSLGEPQPDDYHSDANDLRNYVWYQPEHALPYLAGNLTVYPRNARFAYIGNNPRMLEITSQCIREMKFEHPLHNATSQADSADLIRNYDLLIFDFGLDRRGLNLDNVERVTDWPRELRHSLGAVAGCLEKCATSADAVAKDHQAIADFLVINANHHTFSQFVSQFLIAADTPYPTHVRKGKARVGEERLYRGANWKYTEDLMRSFFAYGEEDHSIAPVAPGTVIDMTTAGKSSQYKDGNWGAMDFTGSWIEGRRAAILFAPPREHTGDLLAYVRINEAYLSLENDPMYIRVFFEGAELSRWTVYTRYEVTVCKAVLPARLLAGKTVCRLEFEIENPQSADRYARAKGQQIIGEDPRELGVKIQKIDFTSADRLQYSLGQALDFTENGDGAFFTNECWTQPDGFGIWTLGPDAALVLLPKEPAAKPLLATFTVTDVAVSATHPLLDASVSFNGRKMAEWTLGPTRLTDERKVLLPEGFPTLDPVNVTFHVPAPQTPLELKWSTWDKRPLGFRLTGFRLEPAGSLKYKLGDVIDLTDGGNSAAFVGDYLGTQWALPDAYGSWTVGHQSTMKVRFEAPVTGPQPAAFIVSDCVVSKAAPSLTVRVKSGARSLAEWEFKDREVHRRSLELPADLLAGAEELILTFEVQTPRSPESLGWTTDSRPLGIRLASMAIGRPELEMPAFGKKTTAPRSMIRRIIGLPGFALHVSRILWRKWNDR
ncbi:MAG TPA: hypothetical protein VEU96_00255 [Bryobacteraceae bacterium]|nr:hypothetical protein [Bryobacteraceae bacterium]